MKLAIIGSRSFNDVAFISSELDKLFESNRLDLIVSGGARGADSIGAEWARSKGIPCKVHLPDWDRYGKSAGFIRNELIINDCDAVIAFWDGKSRGTLHSINLAKKKGRELTILKKDQHDKDL